MFESEVKRNGPFATCLAGTTRNHRPHMPNSLEWRDLRDGHHLWAVIHVFDTCPLILERMRVIENRPTLAPALFHAPGRAASARPISRRSCEDRQRCARRVHEHVVLDGVYRPVIDGSMDTAIHHLEGISDAVRFYPATAIFHQYFALHHHVEHVSRDGSASRPRRPAW